MILITFKIFKLRKYQKNIQLKKLVDIITVNNHHTYIWLHFTIEIKVYVSKFLFKIIFHYKMRVRYIENIYLLTRVCLWLKVYFNITSSYWLLFGTYLSANNNISNTFMRLKYLFNTKYIIFGILYYQHYLTSPFIMQFYYLKTDFYLHYSGCSRLTMYFIKIQYT